MPVATVSNIVVGEGDGHAEFIVRLDAPSTTPVSLEYAAVTGIAAVLYKGIASDRDNPDFEIVAGTLVFAPGETSKTVRVPIVDDSRVEGAEGYTLTLRPTVTLAGPGNVQVARNVAHALIHDNDAVTATPFVSVDDVVVDEKDGVARFVVRLGSLESGGASAAEVRVRYATVDGGARAGEDYVATSGELVFPPGRNVAVVSVPITDDAVREGVERFGLRLSDAVGATILDGEAQAEIGLSDGTAITQPLVRIDSVVVSEADRHADLVVRLSEPALAPYAVPLSLQMPASLGVLAAVTELVFAPGQTTLVARVPLIQDFRSLPSAILGGQTDWQGPLMAGYRATALSGTTAGPAVQMPTLTLIGNDTASALPSVFVDDVVVDERAGQAVFVLRLGLLRGERSNAPVIVEYGTRDGSAVAGEDYVAARGRAVFEPGESVARVAVELIDDTRAEGREQFELLLSNPQGARLGQVRAVADIALSDGAPLARPAVSAEDLVLDETAGSAELVVRLSAPSPNLVTVDYRLLEETLARGELSHPYNSLGGEKLVFAPGQTVVTVRFALLDDNLPESIESLRLELSNPVNATLSRQVVRVQVRDNDSRSENPGIAIEGALVDETAATVGFVVSLGGRAGESSSLPVTVAWRTVDGSARAGEDYVAGSGTLVFEPGESTKTIAVPLLDDRTMEPDERFAIVLDTPAGGRLLTASAQAVIAANDQPPLTQPRLSIADAVVSERDRYVDLRVSLSAPSNQPLDFTLSIARGTSEGSQDYVEFLPTLYTFAPGETVRTVRVLLVDDVAAEPDQHLLVSVAGTTGGALVGSTAAAVTVIDNDAPVETPAIHVHDAFVDEKAGLAHVVVQLGRQQGSASNGVVQVRWATVDGTALAGQDYRGDAGLLVFAPGESAKTISIEITDDPLVEPGERFGVQLFDAGGATIGDGRAVVAIGASDAPAVARPTIAMASTRAAEADGWIDLVLTLDAPSASPLLVVPALGLGASTAGRGDYAPLYGSVAFAPGETLRVLRVAMLTDTVLEPDETLPLGIAAVSQGAATPGPAATLVIVDDDDLSRTVLSHGRSDDVYRPAAAADVIVEGAGGGIDTVHASWNLTLPEHVENAVLDGAAALSATGNAAMNLLIGNAADNRLDGQAGIDTAVFAATRAAATIAGATVASPLDGTDTLVSIERWRFADVLLASDTSPGGNTWLAYAMFQAGFDRGPDAGELGRWTSQLDQLGSGRDLAQAMINFYAPGVPDEVLVTHLWGTVVGTPITAADLSAYVGLIRSGTHTQASLLELAATLPLNTAEIVGIVGQTLALDPAFFLLPG